MDRLKKKIIPGSAFAAFGEIMLRLSAPGNERFFQSSSMQTCFGGGEANVLVSLSLHGLKTVFISALPDNEIGGSALRTLRAYGVDVNNVVRKKESRMGLYFMEKGASQRPSKVIYDREGSAVSIISSGEIDWARAFENCTWFHITGITPALSRKAADASFEALDTAKKMGLVISCDLNYRAKLWKYGTEAREVMKKIAGMCDVLIANEEDCQKSLGIGSAPDHSAGAIRTADYSALCAQVLAEFPDVAYLAITLRESLSASRNIWSACAAFNGNVIFSRKYDISHIVDRVGGGDSFAAGLIYGLSTMSSGEEALEYAASASALAHTIEGDLNLSSPEEISALYSGDSSGRIKR